MIDCSALDATLGQLATPNRNRYFYGKLLDEFHLSMEQEYFNRKRWLLNRLALGSGVLCGLSVAPTRDGRVQVTPGVAIDGYGREIIVPAPTTAVDPRALTDVCGRTTGERLADGTVTLCLAYQECEAEPVPVLVAECDPKAACASSVIREQYAILVTRGEPQGQPGVPCDKLFPEKPVEGFNRLAALYEALGPNCAPPDQSCVVLATVTLSGAAPGTTGAPTLQIDEQRRAVVYSNATLLDLIVCLAERVDQCCGHLPTADLPVVTAIEPANAARVSQTERIVVAFSRPMNPNQLAAPHPWLRMWQLAPPQSGGAQLRAVRIPLQQPEPSPDGRSVSYRFDPLGPPPARYLIQIRAEGNNIRDHQDNLLDAEFTGTGLDRVAQDLFWGIAQARSVDAHLWDQLTGPPTVGLGPTTLPSGDQTPGGVFHSWFETSAEQ